MHCYLPIKALLLLALVCVIRVGMAQSGAGKAVYFDKMPPSGIVLDKGWKFQAGDDEQWAQPDFDDQNWQPINPTLPPRQLPQVEQAGIGWLRLRFQVSPELQRKALILSISQYAASEVYLNGQLLRQYGVVSSIPVLVQAYWPNREPIELPLSDESEQVLAVRVAHWGAFSAFNDFFVPTFFQGHLGGLQQIEEEFKQEAKYKVADMLLFGALLLLSTLHVAFYVYNPNQRANFYFALYTMAEASAFFCTGFLDDIGAHGLRLGMDIVSYASLQIGSVLAVRALYSFFYLRVGRIYYGLWLANIFSLLLLMFGQGFHWYPTVGFMLLVTAEQLRITLGALRQAKRAAGIIALGFGIAFVLLLTFASLSILQSEILRQEVLGIPLHTLLTFSAFLCPVLAISLFLACRFALDSRLLMIKLAQVRRLSAQATAQQEEKQQLLAQQNELLEQQVQQRTAALQQTLSNLQAMQQQLIQSEKMASLGELTAGIAHEIQNPLNFVNNFAEVGVDLLAELKAGPLISLPDKERKSAEELVNDLSQNLEKITYHGKRADSIVKGMLEHSRASRGERQPTDLNALADEYLRLAYHGLRAKHKDFNATLTTDFDKNLGLVELVPQEIGRVLLNLINNAFYAVQQRQRLGQAGYRPEVCVATKRLKNEQVVIRVKDNGMGIPEVIRQKIFHPFFTTKPPGEGTGLGLSLSYDIVTKGHGGTITVATKPGEYTEFAVSLPVSQEHVQTQTLSYSI
ncbi:hypothetical protein GCM10011375_27410 [Hymenobacter qilianensis]|uniref:Uncharacterized protein n=2 Tax=Hymenobacter qilianensis TaxID=1385715 RepID=A0ACB5PTQ6_9BACT|nr:hypothetical protein GCM10011375_27410 [Hymenobacter qilianensis]